MQPLSRQVIKFLITPVLSECSDRDFPAFVANNLKDRLGWADPEKYTNAHAYSSYGTTMISIMRPYKKSNVQDWLL